MRSHLRGYLQHVLNDAVPMLLGLALAYATYYLLDQAWSTEAAIFAAPILGIGGWQSTRVALTIAYRAWPDLNYTQDTPARASRR